MSGFISIYNSNGEQVDRSLLYSLTQTLKFRGPDQQNMWTDGNIGMGHALFKTTFEAEYENQPSTIDNKVWITSSARIDDRENLVNKMGLKQSLDLSKTPDSELILHAYKKWGEECLEHLLGDFAFVIWDKTQQKLFCARDRFGIRQLYFIKKNHSFISSNCLNSLLKHPMIKKDLNEKAIGGFLLFGDFQRIDSSLTAFQDINALKPAHSLTLHNNKISLKKYWNISSSIPLLLYKNKNEYIEHFLDVFQTAVADRIRTSSITIAMSGGMDSTTIAAISKRLSTKQPFGIQAITGVYEELIPDDEQYYAALVAKKLNIPIKFINADEFSFMKSKLITTSPMEIISTDFWFEIRKQASQYGRVTLAGYAADNVLDFHAVKTAINGINPFTVLLELIKSYYHYKSIPPLGFGIMKKVKHFTQLKTEDEFIGYPTWLSSEFQKKQDLKELWKKYKQVPFNTNLRYSQAYEGLTHANWNTDDILFNSPITLPEVRDPFLDLRFIEFIFSLPPLPWIYKKHIIRTSMKNILPDIVLKRPKTFLGNLSYEYLKQPKNKWADSWSPTTELSNFICINKLPYISSKLYSNINLRPLYLNIWLENIKQLNKI